MSLINEALKRARAEAETGDARRSRPMGVPLEPPATGRSRGRRNELLAAAAVLLLPVLLFVAAALYYVARSSSGDQPVPAEPDRLMPPPAPLAEPAHAEAPPAPVADPDPPPAPAPPLAAEPAPAPPAFMLSGILRSGDEFRAILNGQVLRVGDTVDDARIEAIDSQGVRLRVAGEAVHVPLPPQKF
jgi:hypothetical protein